MIVLSLAVFAGISTSAAEAQSQLFSPLLKVDTRVVTRYQLDQRTRFLTLLNAPGSARDLALQQLTDEALQLSAAKKAGITLSDEEVQSGMAEFAGRANLSVEQFITAIRQAGVDAETFRDFASAGIVWRKYIQRRFASTADNVSRDDVELAEQFAATDGGERVLLSEIILPANSPAARQVSLARAQRLSAITDPKAFSAEARRFSAVPTRSAGGEVPWRDLASLPDDVRGTIAALSPGQATRPIIGETAISVFFMRDRETVSAGTAAELGVDYLLVTAPGASQAAMASLAASADRCDELSASAGRLQGARVVRETRAFSSLPAQIARASTGLDQFETAVISDGSQPALLMLCGRKFPGASSIDRDRLRLNLINARLATLAAAHLAELRDAANIRRYDGG